MASNDQDEVIVDFEEDITNEEVTENTEEKVETTSKPKRTPQEEYEYFTGRAERLAKKHGFGKKAEKSDASEVKDSPKPNELDYGQKAFLKTYGIQGSDELALVRSFATRTGDDLDTIVSDDIFLGKLKALRDARESSEAIPKGKGRSAQASVTNIDIAYANYLERGEWPTDFETAKALKNKIVELDKGSASIYARK
jgi:hypothetical protein